MPSPSSPRDDDGWRKRKHAQRRGWTSSRFCSRTRYWGKVTLFYCPLSGRFIRIYLPFISVSQQQVENKFLDSQVHGFNLPREQETVHDRLRTQERGTKEELPVQPRTNDGRAEVLLILLTRFHTYPGIILFACEHRWCVTGPKIAIVTTSQLPIKKGVERWQCSHTNRKKRIGGNWYPG